MHLTLFLVQLKQRFPVRKRGSKNKIKIVLNAVLGKATSRGR
jgi:hypothetical protein